MSAAARRLSAPGAAALAVFRVPHTALPAALRLHDRAGREREWPRAGRWALGLLMLGERRLDEVIVLGRRDEIELHTHGAALLVSELESVLGVDRSRAWIEECEQATRSLRGVRALASARNGPLAKLVEGLLERSEQGSFAASVAADLDRARKLLPFGAHLLRPPRICLVGLANAGKSTLFNRLIGETRALVSDRAGTTRDSVTQEILIAGVPVQLEDSAGSQAVPGAVRGADLLIHVLSSEAEEPLGDGAPTLRVLGRADERTAGSLSRVSGSTGEGVPELLAASAARLGLNRPAEDDSWTPLLPAHRALITAHELG